MRAEILSIGTEILVGSILNTNARFLSERLAERGIDVYRHATVGDNLPRLVEAFQTALGRSDWVICSGGLGPTDDDVTMEAAARALGVTRVFSKETERHIRERLRAARFSPSKLSMNQCRVPKNALLFQNEYGTAPGILAETTRGGETKTLVLLPGPPSEMEPMFLNQAWPALAAKRFSSEAFFIRTIKIASMTETQVAEKIGDLLKRKPPVTCGIYAKAGEVQLKIMSKATTLESAKRQAAPVERFLRRTFADKIFGADDDTPASAAVAALRKKRSTLALAESCTGGLTSHLLTEIPGSSDVFRGAVVAYANPVKEAVLGVSGETLKKNGAVSRQTAGEMARGVRQALSASIGIAITGIAGPSGGSTQKPVGLVYIGLSDRRGTVVSEHHFAGNRATVKIKSARKALDILRLRLSS